MNSPIVDLYITLFNDDKELLEKLVAHRDEPVLLLMRQWIRRTALRCGLMGEYSPGAQSENGPTEKIRVRAAVFRRLKDAHPAWSMDRVAMEASRELGEIVTGETVRNAYRAMGWKWCRGDRVR